MKREFILFSSLHEISTKTDQKLDHIIQKISKEFFKQQEIHRPYSLTTPHMKLENHNKSLHEKNTTFGSLKIFSHVNVRAKKRNVTEYLKNIKKRH